MSVRRILRGVVALMVLATGLVGALGSPASADPAITLSTSAMTHITNGTPVHVELTDFPGGASRRGIWICPTESVPAVGGFDDDFDPACALLTQLAAATTAADVTVYDANTGIDYDIRRGFRCTTLPSGCSLVGADLSTSRVVSVASAPITFPSHPWTVTPDAGPISPWQPTRVTMQGFPVGPATIGVCGAGARSQTACVPLATFPAGMPAQADVAIPYVFTASTGGRQRCDKPCVLTAWVDRGFGTAPDAMDFATVAFTAPSVSVTPAYVAHGAPYTITGSGLPPGPVSAVQCGGTSNTSPTGYHGCVAGTLGTVATDGTVTIQSVASIPTAGGNCASSCNIGVLVGDGFAFTTEVPVDAPSIASTTAPPFFRDENVWMEIRGFGSGKPTVVQCKLPLGADYASSQCGAAVDFIFIGGSGYVNITARHTLETPAGTVSCAAPESCAIALFRADNGRPAVPPTPITWERQLVFAPSDAAYDGEVVDLTATDLPANRAVRVVRCSWSQATGGRACERPSSVPLLTTDAEGGLSTQRTLAQNLIVTGEHRYRHCRNSGCSFAVVSADGSTTLANVHYWLNEPVVSASRATGLSDGDTVTVAGANMQPTYAGPTVLLPTGRWAILQCDKAVGTSTTSLLEPLFERCAVAPGGESVTVVDHASSTEVQVQGTITKILGGGTTDCTAAPGACVIGFARWEQDGRATTEFIPISFG